MKVSIEREYRVLNGKIEPAQLKIESTSIAAGVLNLTNLSQKHELNLEPRGNALIVYLPFFDNLEMFAQIQDLIDDIASIDQTTVAIQGNKHLQALLHDLDVPAEV